jgi:hypothetical protein
MYEHKSAPLLPRGQFFGRLARSFGVTLLIVAGSLLLGTSGYHWLGGLSWIDALLNAAMILTGMGPVSPMTTTAGKLFATFYALYSGIAFLTMMAVIASPIVHRFMHKFHLEDEDQ